jgi:hypothetical protein
MDLFERLNQSISEEYNNGELHLNLVAPLQQVANNPDQFNDKLSIVETLLKQVNAFEPYCDCGCFAEGFNTKDVLKTLAQLGINPQL